MVESEGFASLEPPDKQSKGLFTLREICKQIFSQFEILTNKSKNTQKGVFLLWRRARDSRLCDLPDKMSTGHFSPSDKLLMQFSPYSHPSPFSQKKRCIIASHFFGGERGIRTPVGVNPNGFQDRLVVTTSIALHIIIKLITRSYTIKTVVRKVIP